MRWFDRNFDYINEFIERWNKQIKRRKYTFIVIALILAAVGACCIFLPAETFTVMQILAAAALIIQGIYFIISYACTTYYFKDPMQIVTGILNILLGILLFFSPIALTASTLTFMFAFLLLFSGAEKLSFASKMNYYRIMDTGFLTFSGILNIILAIIFLVLPLVSMLVLNYILAAYLIVSGIALFIEALSMKKIKF